MAKKTKTAANADVEASPSTSAVRPHSIDLSGPSPVQQHFKATQDVNNIVRAYSQTGIDPYAERKAREQFGYATSQSFTEAMYHVREVENAFNSLPSNIRSEHHNDPSRWLEHLSTIGSTPAENVAPAPSEAVSEDATPSDSSETPPTEPQAGAL